MLKKGAHCSRRPSLGLSLPPAQAPPLPLRKDTLSCTLESFRELLKIPVLGHTPAQLPPESLEWAPGIGIFKKRLGNSDVQGRCGA